MIAAIPILPYINTLVRWGSLDSEVIQIIIPGAIFILGDILIGLSWPSTDQDN